MTEKKQQHEKKRGKVQHIRGSPKKRKISAHTSDPADPPARV